MTTDIVHAGRNQYLSLDNLLFTLVSLYGQLIGQVRVELCVKESQAFVPSSVNNINHSAGGLMRHWRGSLVGLCCVFISELQNESALMT